MDTVTILKEQNEEDVIKMLENKTLNCNVNQLFIDTIYLNKIKIANYLIDKIDKNYTNEVGLDILQIAVLSSNLDVIKLLHENNFNFDKFYFDCMDKGAHIISSIGFLNVFKYFEDLGYIEKYKNELDNIILRVLNLELVKYIVEKYDVDVTKIVYETPDKNYTLLEHLEDLYGRLKESEKRKREMAFFVDDILQGEDCYDRVVKRAYALLEKLENDNKEFHKYLMYIKSLFEAKKED